MAVAEQDELDEVGERVVDILKHTELIEFR